ncbi:tumor necrosis factor receptor superfamily member 14 isoform X2 [Rhinoderma darwinii]|uniref:tumor necrosis factor receptor superfamily member 14 isoform X2 n=1 Tax=Rhinoderma darwinii TaxID=43563 RepID=UPI003F672AFA
MTGTRGVHFLLAIYPLFLLVNLTLSCLPGEYQMNNFCCPKCDKGSFVKAHCTSESSSSVCVICADNLYIDLPNGLTECFRCKECDPGANLAVKEKCTSSKNTVCECKAGHFCPHQDCDICQDHTQCPPGQFVRKSGTPQTDAVCEECPPRHFSNGSNSDECLPWKKCSEMGMVLYKEGTSITDSICKEKRSRILIGVAFLPPVVVVILALKTINSSLKEEENTDVYNCKFSEQEVGT